MMGYTHISITLALVKQPYVALTHKQIHTLKIMCLTGSPSFKTFSLAKKAFPNANRKLSGTCSARAMTSKMKTRSRSES